MTPIEALGQLGPLFLVFASVALLAGSFVLGRTLRDQSDARRIMKARSERLAARRAEVAAKGITYGDRW